MSETVNGGELDPRLANPDAYYLEHYGNVVIIYGDKTPMTLETALQFERLARSDEEINQDSPTRRAAVYTDMLRQADALRPEDDIDYTESA